MFFSKTDKGGRIIAGNEVFARVAGYTPEELSGASHNIVRHPDMPRAAFAVLWRNLSSGLPFNGYVKNLAKDGTYYWVFASMGTLRDGNRLSVRFKPTTDEFRSKIPALYAAILASEQQVLCKHGTEKEATQAGVEKLDELVRAQGFGCYDEFAEASLVREIAARDAELAKHKLALFPPQIGAVEKFNLARVFRGNVERYRVAVGLFGALERIGHLSKILRDETISVIDVAEEFRLAALNGNIASGRHGHNGACIGVIAGFLTSYASGMARDTTTVRDHLKVLSESARAIAAAVAMARLELEMLLFFQAELARGGSPEQLKLLPGLEESFHRDSARAAQAIESLANALPPIATSRDALAQAVTSIQMAQVRGLTEVARLSDSEGIRTMFEEFRTKTVKAREEIDRISDVLSEFGALMQPMTNFVGRLDRVTS
jgi:aerotaxis receptor